MTTLTLIHICWP